MMKHAQIRFESFPSVLGILKVSYVLFNDVRSK